MHHIYTISSFSCLVSFGLFLNMCITYCRKEPKKVQNWHKWSCRTATVYWTCESFREGSSFICLFVIKLRMSGNICCIFVMLWPNWHDVQSKIIVYYSGIPVVLGFFSVICALFGCRNLQKCDKFIWNVLPVNIFVCVAFTLLWCIHVGLCVAQVTN